MGGEGSGGVLPFLTSHPLRVGQISRLWSVRPSLGGCIQRLGHSLSLAPSRPAGEARRVLAGAVVLAVHRERRSRETRGSGNFSKWGEGPPGVSKSPEAEKVP